MELERVVRNTIAEHRLIERGDRVIIGLSGGPDSVCLFSLLRALSEEWALRLYAVHVNHGLRPGAADEDQRYVEALCREAGAPCDVAVFDCAAAAREWGVTSEEAGRNARYEAFARTADKLVKREAVPAAKIKIAVAHNKNDQAETALMRILRGTGPDGLAGMAYARKDASGFSVVRPLLDAERAEILRYCAEKGLNPKIDQTNELPLYTRNKIRLELIPYLTEQYNENIVEALTRLARAAKEDKKYWSEQTEKALETLRTDSPEWNEHPRYSRVLALDRAGLSALAPGLRHRVIPAAFAEIGLERDLAAAHLKAADDIIESGNASASLDFPRGYGMMVSYGRVGVFRESKSPARQKAPGARALENMALSQRIVDRSEFEAMGGRGSENGRAALDYERVVGKLAETGGSLSLRARRPGDYFTPAGMKSGRKKMQDYFVDQKIPKDRRDQEPLVCAGAEVVWIIGAGSRGSGRISGNYAVTPGTGRVLLLEVHQE